MAFISAPAPAVRFNPLKAIWNALVAAGENSKRMQRIQRLQSLSDEQLSKLGMKREEIVQHVFKDVYWV